MKKYTTLITVFYALILVLSACSTAEPAQPSVEDGKSIYQPADIDLESALRYTANDYLNGVITSYTENENSVVEVLMAWKDMDGNYSCYVLIDGQAFYEMSITPDNVVSVEEKDYRDYLRLQEID